MHRELRVIYNILRSRNLSATFSNEWVDEWAAILRTRGGQPILPNPGESLAVTFHRPKTAALAFDRILWLPGVEDGPPSALQFYGATEHEMRLWAYGRIARALHPDGDNRPSEEPLASVAERAATERYALRRICSQIANVVGSHPTIILANATQREHEFAPGPQAILATAISNCRLVDEAALTWEQVMELRNDTEARQKYRRLVRWIDPESVSQTPTELRDLIATRLDDYEWTLRKHGLQSLVGSLSSLIDPTFVGAMSPSDAASGMAASRAWSALPGASFIVGRANLSCEIAYVESVDALRKDSHEVACLYDVPTP